MESSGWTLKSKTPTTYRPIPPPTRAKPIRSTGLKVPYHPPAHPNGRARLGQGRQGKERELYDRIEAMSVKVIVLLNVEYGTVS